MLKYGYRLTNNDVCYLGQLRPVGVSDLIPHKTLLKIFINYPVPSPMWCYPSCSINIEKGPLLETDTYSSYKRQAQKHTQTPTGTLTGTSRLMWQSADRHRFRFIQQTENGRHEEHKVENSIWTPRGPALIFFFNVTVMNCWWLWVNH